MSTAARKIVKPSKGMIPTGFANGGKASPFSGKDTKAEEMSEAKSVRSGKVTPKGYAASEQREEKKEGEKPTPRKALIQKGKDMASGKLTPSQYGAAAKKANGGMVKGYSKKGC
ncbi:hypothetical protein UFOVP1298_74 [uncultured Caudovirales phage]|jgi:hypothetical protein|uniref:Uncharacterized protein n=1 Tax=uncultured Caudovirales phage TaxID=2100421 RepID=A0A6J5RH50_9CAUD|nr:hypothetical protein UFOVP1298_74 [uncultured Caudovirales phage]